MRNLFLILLIVGAWAAGFCGFLRIAPCMQTPPPVVFQAAGGLWLVVTFVITNIFSTLRGLYNDAGLPRSKLADFSKISEEIHRNCVILLVVGAIIALSPMVGSAFSPNYNLLYALMLASAFSSVAALFLAYQWLKSVNRFLSRMIAARRKADDMKGLSADMGKR